MSTNYIRLIIQGLVFIILQLLLFRNIALFDVAFCFIYIAVILSIPLETGRIFTMFIAFLVGFLVDVFYNTFGIHASAAVLMAFVRHYWVVAITPQGGYESNLSPSFYSLGSQLFITYALPLVFVHHFALFFTEAGGFSLFGSTIIKVFLSTLFTFIVILILQVVFFNPRRGS